MREGQSGNYELFFSIQAAIIIFFSAPCWSSYYLVCRLTQCYSWNTHLVSVFESPAGIFFLTECAVGIFIYSLNVKVDIANRLTVSMERLIFRLCLDAWIKCLACCLAYCLSNNYLPYDRMCEQYLSTVWLNVQQMIIHRLYYLTSAWTVSNC